MFCACREWKGQKIAQVFRTIEGFLLLTTTAFQMRKSENMRCRKCTVCGLYFINGEKSKYCSNISFLDVNRNANWVIPVIVEKMTCFWCCISQNLRILEILVCMFFSLCNKVLRLAQYLCAQSLRENQCDVSSFFGLCFFLQILRCLMDTLNWWSHSTPVPSRRSILLPFLPSTLPPHTIKFRLAPTHTRALCEKYRLASSQGRTDCTVYTWRILSLLLLPFPHNTRIGPILSRTSPLTISSHVPRVIYWTLSPDDFWWPT